MSNFFKDFNLTKNSKNVKLFLNLVLSTEKKVILQILGLNLISNIFEILGLGFFVSVVFDDKNTTNISFINNNSLDFFIFIISFNSDIKEYYKVPNQDLYRSSKNKFSREIKTRISYEDNVYI